VILAFLLLIPILALFALLIVGTSLSSVLEEVGRSI
jgi:hypothetical protein